MYIAACQGQTSPRDKILMSTETICHFGHLIQVSKKSPWSLILYNFFMILYMYIAPGQGLTTPWGWNFDVNRNILSLRSFVASFKKSLWSLILYSFFFFFHVFIHVYSTGAGEDSPQGTKFWFHFFHDLIHVYSPGAGVDSPQGTQFWCQQKGLITLPICCKFQSNTFEVWFYTIFFMI